MNKTMSKPIRDRPLTIALVTREYPPETGYGGIGTYCDTMARALVSRGYQVIVLSDADGKPESYVQRDGVHIYRVLPRFDVSRLPVVWRLNKLWTGYRLAVALKLRELVQKHVIDLIETSDIHGEPLLYSLLPGHRPILVRLQSSLTLSLTYNRAPMNPRTRITLHAERWMLRHAAYISSPSRALWQITNERVTPIAPERCTVIPHPTNTERFQPIDSIRANRSAINPLVLYAGRIEWWKGVDILVQAIPLVLAQVPNARFLLVGADRSSPNTGGSLREELRASLPETCRARVEFRDGVLNEALPMLYNAADIVVVPSRWEGFGLVCAEALACGCATLASRVGGLAEIIEDEKSGLLFESENVEDLAHKLIRLLCDPALRESLGQHARQRIATYCAVDPVVDQMTTLYQNVLRQSDQHLQKQSTR